MSWGVTPVAALPSLHPLDSEQHLPTSLVCVFEKITWKSKEPMKMLSVIFLNHEGKNTSGRKVNSAKETKRRKRDLPFLLAPSHKGVSPYFPIGVVGACAHGVHA